VQNRRRRDDDETDTERQVQEHRLGQDYDA
jgi:hypothetical protein